MKMFLINQTMVLILLRFHLGVGFIPFAEVASLISYYPHTQVGLNRLRGSTGCSYELLSYFLKLILCEFP